MKIYIKNKDGKYLVRTNLSETAWSNHEEEAMCVETIEDAQSLVSHLRWFYQVKTGFTIISK